MMTPKLVLEYNPNRRSHEDIVVHAEHRQYVCDSYYFAIGRGLRNARNPDETALDLLVVLLDQWLHFLSRLTPARTIYLPYDLSDEYTGCLACSLTADGLVVTPGVSRRAGYEVDPSRIADYVYAINDFCPNGSAMRFNTLAEFASDIEASRTVLVKRVVNN